MQTQPVNFNGVPLPSFIKVTGRTVSVLPPTEIKYKKLPRQMGGFFSRTDLNPRQYKLQVAVTLDDQHNLDEQLDIFGQWLRGNNFEPSALTFMEQPDRYVLAVVDGSTDIEDMFLVGKGSITFLAVNPVKYLYSGLEKKDKAPLPVNYLGDIEQPLICSFKLSKNCSKIELSVDTFSDRKILLVGTFKKDTVIEVDSNKKVVKVNGLVNMKVLALESEWLRIKSGRNVVTVKLDNTVAAETLNISSKIALY